MVEAFPLHHCCLAVVTSPAISYKCYISPLKLAWFFYYEDKLVRNDEANQENDKERGLVKAELQGYVAFSATSSSGRRLVLQY